MPRQARITVPGAAHHVTQRGHNKRDVFRDDEDRAHYLSLLARFADTHGCRVAGYCLMTNHIHLIMIPDSEQSLSKTMEQINAYYGRHFNSRYHRDGALWARRFYSCPMDPPHAINAMCYVELNPVRAGIVKRIEDYPWSSAAAHLGLTPGDSLLDLARWRQRWTVAAWRAMVDAFEADRSGMECIRKHTRTGRPIGDEAYFARTRVNRNQSLVQE